MCRPKRKPSFSSPEEMDQILAELEAKQDLAQFTEENFSDVCPPRELWDYCNPDFVAWLMKD